MNHAMLGAEDAEEQAATCDARRASRVISSAFHSSLFILTKKLKAKPVAALLSKIVSLLQLLSFLFSKVSPSSAGREGGLASALRRSPGGLLAFARRLAPLGDFFVQLLVRLPHRIAVPPPLLLPLQDLAWADSPALLPLSWVSKLTTVAGYKQWFSAGSYLALYYISLGWVAMFCGLFAYAILSFAAGNIRYLWPLHMLRAVGSFSASVLFVPMFTLLLSNFQCQDVKEVRGAGVHAFRTPWRGVSGCADAEACCSRNKSWLRACAKFGHVPRPRE